MSPAPYLRLWFRHEGEWFHRQFATADPAWRRAFSDLAGSRYNVRIEYLHELPAHDSPHHLPLAA